MIIFLSQWLVCTLYGISRTEAGTLFLALASGFELLFEIPALVIVAHKFFGGKK